LLTVYRLIGLVKTAGHRVGFFYAFHRIASQAEQAFLRSRTRSGGSNPTGDQGKEDDADRVAGLVILLYAQQMTAVIRLRASQVSDEDGRILLRLGTSPIQLAPPLDQIMRDLLAGRRGRSMLGSPGESP
jgi:hypothetical protein